jgi:hypothetical protein
MIQEIINQVSIFGDSKSLKSILRKFKLNKGENICNFFPFPKDLIDKDDCHFIEKLRLYEKYKVTSRSEWVNNYWGNEDFSEILEFRELDHRVDITFISQFSDAKIILVNIQKKLPHLKLFGEFQKVNENIVERFETMSLNGEIFYQINDRGFCKYVNSTQLRVDELKNQNTNFHYNQAA